MRLLAVAVLLAVLALGCGSKEAKQEATPEGAADSTATDLQTSPDTTMGGL